MYAVILFIIISAIFIPVYVDVQKETYISKEKETLSVFVDNLVSTVDLKNKEQIDDYFEEYNEDGYKITIFDNNKKIIYSTVRHKSKNPLQITPDLSEFSENAKPYYEYNDYSEGIYYKKIFNVRGNNYYCNCRLNLKVLDSIFDYTNDNIFIILISYIIISSIALFILLSFAIKPIEKLSKITSKISKKDFSQKYEGKIRNDEIGALAKNINDMADTIQSNINALSNYNFILKQNLTELTQYEEMKTKAVRNITHELKTPLAIISSQIEMMNYTSDEEKKKYYYNSAMDEISKMSRLVTNILDFSFDDKDIFGDDVKKINISDVVVFLCKTSENYIKYLNRNIETEIEKNCILNISKNHIEHIFNNYLMNAIQHSKADAKIKITLRKFKNKVRLSVYNDGKNISEKYKDSIWKEAFSGNNDSSDNNRGLGLYIVKEISLINKTKCGYINHPDGVEFWYDFVDRK